MDQTYREIDFRPAPPGWRIVYLDSSEPGATYIVDVPGWLIMGEVYYSERTSENDWD